MIQNTHTLNKSNQFYISKISQDSLVSTHLHMYPLWWPNHIVPVHVSKVAKNLVDSKFEKMVDQDEIHTAYEKLYKVSKKHGKLYRLATRKLSDVELDQEELSTKFDEANQTIGALWFENNFLAERTKKFEAELFQVRAQLERTSSAKLDKMLSF